MTTGPLLAAILAAVAIGAGLIRAWMTRRALGKRSMSQFAMFWMRSPRS